MDGEAVLRIAVGRGARAVGVGGLRRVAEAGHGEGRGRPGRLELAVDIVGDVGHGPRRGAHVVQIDRHRGRRRALCRIFVGNRDVEADIPGEGRHRRRQVARVDDAGRIGAVGRPRRDADAGLLRAGNPARRHIEARERGGVEEALHLAEARGEGRL